MSFYFLLLKNIRDFSNDIFHNIIDAACIIALDESINYSNDPAFSIIFKSQKLCDIRNDSCSNKSCDDTNYLLCGYFRCCHIARK